MHKLTSLSSVVLAEGGNSATAAASAIASAFSSGSQSTYQSLARATATAIASYGCQTVYPVLAVSLPGGQHACFHSGLVLN